MVSYFHVAGMVFDIDVPISRPLYDETIIEAAGLN